MGKYIEVLLLNIIGLGVIGLGIRCVILACEWEEALRFWEAWFYGSIIVLGIALGCFFLNCGWKAYEDE